MNQHLTCLQKVCFRDAFTLLTSFFHLSSRSRAVITASVSTKDTSPAFFFSCRSRSCLDTGGYILPESGLPPPCVFQNLSLFFLLSFPFHFFASLEYSFIFFPSFYLFPSFPCFSLFSTFPLFLLSLKGKLFLALFC